MKVRILESRGLPLVSSIGLHFDPFGLPNGSTTSVHKGVV